jgi:23S rRNA (guanosine2251-2'-O)-methyltransferase
LLWPDHREVLPDGLSNTGITGDQMSNSQRVCGIHVIANLLASKPQLIKSLWAARDRSDQRSEALQQLAAQAGIRVQQSTPAALAKLAGVALHQGWVADFQPDNLYGEQDLPELLQQLQEPALLLMLDGVQDPHNLGACLRSAEAAGVQLVLLPRQRAAGLTAVARRAAAGAAELLPICEVVNLARAMRTCQQQHCWIIGTSDAATTGWAQVTPQARTLLVMGSEEKGLRRLTMEHCDQLASLPMYGRISSLNVSVATGICLFDLRRQLPTD